MECIVLKEIKIEKVLDKFCVGYKFDAPVIIKRYLRENNLFVEFPGNSDNIPEAVLAIPFVGIMLTVAMLLDVKIQVPELDASFYRSLKEIEKTFNNMYPKAGIKIIVEAKEICPCEYQSLDTRSLFFTGGVDATCALTELAGINPLLINIWGGDLWITDDASHLELETYLNNLTKHLGLNYCFVKTNARAMFNENDLDGVCKRILGRKSNHGWWASIAHILSMVTTIAPLMWINKTAVHYIASSYDANIKTFDSNNEEVINAIKYCSCSFSMVDSETGRNEKVKKIICYKNMTGAPIQLKVCWYRVAGKNCNNCEKCYRTIMNIIANHADPNDYGFNVDGKVIKKIKDFLMTNIVSEAFWIPIQKAFIREKDFWQEESAMSWILKIKINSPQTYLLKIGEKLKKCLNL